MTLKRMTAEQSQSLRDAIEGELATATSKALKAFLARVRGAALAAINSDLPNSLLAAGSDEMPPLGTLAGWWAQEVDVEVVMSVRAAFSRVLRRLSDGGYDIDSPAMEAARDFIASVRDRLVTGAYFGVNVYEGAFERIRESLAMSVAEGWTRPQLAQHIAAELGWEKDGPYWRQVQADTDAKIDSILDALGEPGTPAREYARLHDPRIKSLRDARNVAIKHLDAERSVWKDRAMLIARTESTSTMNHAGLMAFVSEGVKTKVWVATGDGRTRATHAAASGEEVGLNSRFAVGGARLRYPGDPSGPVDEVANCRCTMIAGDYI